MSKQTQAAALRAQLAALPPVSDWRKVRARVEAVARLHRKLARLNPPMDRFDLPF